MGKTTVVGMAALTTLALSTASFRASAEAAPLASALDDPTIIAIFEAANTVDIETGTVAAERGSSKAELKALVVQVAPAFEAHMIAAHNLEKKLAGR